MSRRDRFDLWIARTLGDIRTAGERAGVSERTARRWFAHGHDHSGATEAAMRSPLDGLLGRSRELRRIRMAFAGGSRLVTLLGPPGVGKSRLAEEYAAAAMPFFPSAGVTLCDARSARTDDELRHAVAGALGVRAEEMDRRLNTRSPTLLVIDGAEGARSAAASAVASWLRSAPDLMVLVASRAALRLRDEVLIHVSPLAEADAVALFRDRLRCADAEQREPPDLATLARIARELDCLPRSIELAARRAKVIGLAGLEQRLAGELLASDAELEHSWPLLSADAQAALSQISVFVGPFTIRAAEDVVLGPRSVIDALEELRDHSLVERRGPHLVLLRSVRRFAAGKLRDEAALRARLAAFLAARIGDDDIDEAELDEVESALASCADAGQRALLAVGIAERRRGTAWEAALAALEDDAAWPASGPGRARLLLARGALLTRQLRLVEARDDLRTALDASRQGQGAALRGRAHGALGICLALMGQPGRGLRHLRAAEGLAATVDERAGAFLWCAALAAGSGHHAEAAYRLHELLATPGLSASRRGDAQLLLAYVAFAEGKLEEAAGFVSVTRELGESPERGEQRVAADLLLGFIRQEQRLIERALDHHQRAGAAAAELRSPLLAGIAALGTALAQHEAGETAIARVFYRQALRSLRHGAPELRGVCLAALAHIEARLQRLEEAKSSFASAEALLGHSEAPFASSLLATFAHGTPAAAEHPLARIAGRIAATPHIEGALTIEKEGAQVILPGRMRIDLGNRGPARRVLMALVGQRIAAPEHALGADSLIRAAWPDDRASHSALRDRLKVTLATLRRIGLRGLILRTEHGYMLSPEVPIVLTHLPADPRGASEAPARTAPDGASDAGERATDSREKR